MVHKKIVILEITQQYLFKVFYKLESIAMWRGIEMNTGTSYYSTFICENNNFKFGYNNTTENPKLYKPINTSCSKIGIKE